MILDFCVSSDLFLQQRINEILKELPEEKEVVTLCDKEIQVQVFWHFQL